MCHTSDSPQEERLSASYSEQNQDDKAPTALTVLGGDARQLALAARLSELGYHVNAIGLGDRVPELVRLCHHFQRAAEGSRIWILPLPVTRDGVQVSCPLQPQYSLSLSELVSTAARTSGIRIFGGRIPEAWVDELSSVGASVTDYYTREDLQIKNARITAEGALMTAMELTDTILLGASMAVVGYGRIGQLLSRMLVSLGVKVTAFARREESLALAASDGCHTERMTNLGRLTTGYDVIFNTVPARIMKRDVLMSMPCSTLIIDLASSPGGIDPEAAGEATRRCGLHIVYAPALPGRYAPATAGCVIADCIASALEEVKVK